MENVRSIFPHVPRSMNGTEGTRGTGSGNVPPSDRMDTILDALATANRAARVHAEELRRLQFVVLWFAGLVMAMFVWTQR